ncbi:hypothetical protein [Mammaliicoccus sp. E-M21]|uniref:hypothetical protein n=1 Tax=Mammaliicoccus sp. E-M21 TaxID=2898681 RepID=UPI001EFA8FF0|nr:hypothetical protein [Mammaliicoccus sp. E-M21]
MSNPENFREYPRILKIEDDGKIIALDKSGKINTDLNIYSIDDEKQRLVFGKVIYNPYSRSDRNYDNNNKRPEDYYNQRDREREWQIQEENKRTKSKNKWLGILLSISIVVIIGIITMNVLTNDTEDSNNDLIPQQNEQLKSEIDSTKEELRNSQQNEQQTQQRINELQDKVNNLNANNQNNASDELQQGIDKLQEAQNSKINGNEEEMKEKLKQIDEVIDTEKLSEQGKNQWEKFKGWLGNQFNDDK